MGQRSIILQIQSQNKINKTKLWIKKQVTGNRKNKQSNKKKKTKTKKKKNKNKNKQTKETWQTTSHWHTHNYYYQKQPHSQTGIKMNPLKCTGKKRLIYGIYL